MALQNTRKDNYPLWYQNVVSAADMAENSASPGCMVIKPWGYGLWENTQKFLDEKIKETGHENCYFPMFIPLSFFQREADHVEGFAKEMAVVTHSRLETIDGKLVPASPLEEPLIVRPTSEAIIADSFSKWIESYRDLPVMINQWANVVRWEMRPRLFLRTREFLWQEGHTAHANEKEAEIETLNMLEVYRQTSEEDLAMPVIMGKKPEHEKFPGAVDTYCIESMMQDGKALQAGTSHYLGQTFSKSSNISFTNDKGEKEFAYTTSWGVSTRLIGGLIMSHSDDEGLISPPKVAPYQIIIIPIFRNEEDEKVVMEYINNLEADLKKQTPFGAKIRIKVDKRDRKSQDKFWEWTRKGAPIICEVGPRDVAGNKIMSRERIALNTDNAKELVDMSEFVSTIGNRLENIQNKMFEKAKKRLDKHTTTNIKTNADFVKYFSKESTWVDEDDNAVAFVRGKWCGCPESEEILKEMKITIRCIPFDQSNSIGECLLTGKKDATMDVIYARSY